MNPTGMGFGGVKYPKIFLLAISWNVKKRTEDNVSSPPFGYGSSTPKIPGIAWNAHICI